MAPTLLTGDRILASPIREPIARGQIVIHLWAGKPYIKRVVAVSGDTVAMAGGQLTIDGKEVREPYARREPEDPVVSEFEWQGSHLADSTARKTYQPSLHTWGPLVVPGEHYFVLGDNRNNSADSRYFGFIARDSIIARPTVVYFSSDPVTGTIRWDRIGYSAERPTVRRSAASP
jgi:signal peptidase I